MKIFLYQKAIKSILVLSKSCTFALENEQYVSVVGFVIELC